QRVGAFSRPTVAHAQRAVTCGQETPRLVPYAATTSVRSVRGSQQLPSPLRFCSPIRVRIRREAAETKPIVGTEQAEALAAEEADVAIPRRRVPPRQSLVRHD